MKYFFVFSLAGLVFFSSCGHAGHPAAQTTQDSARTDTAKNDFFPVEEYLETEILRVDSTPFSLKQYTTINNNTDSAFIQIPEFNALALQFLAPEFRNGSWEKNYAESSFFDKATNTVTFSYAATTDSASLQRVDVITTPKNGNQQVKSIYMEKTRTSGDSTILDKMYWRAMRNFQIVSIIHIKGRPNVERRRRVVWDSDEEDE